MKWWKVLVCHVAVLGMVSSSVAAESKGSASPLQLFGVKVKGASRDQLRVAFKEGGLAATRENDRYWVDTYNPQGVMEGASAFSAGYLMNGRTFAYAEYEFRGFMNTELVTKVANMVINKYGPPSYHSGQEGLGAVTYKWNLPQGMLIQVQRGWPDTTTYLSFVDNAVFAEMKREQESDKQAAEKEKAKEQSKAF